MRYLILMAVLLMSVPVSTQVWAQSVDWNKIGRPLGEDTKELYDRFVYLDESKTADPNVSLAEPILSLQSTALWIEGSVSQVMGLTSQNYRQELNALKPYFTDKGYVAFTKFLVNEGIINTIEKNQTNLNTVVKFTPDILADAVFNDVYRWNADVPLMLSYRNAGVPQTEMHINVDVVRVPFGKNADGMAFDYWQVRKDEGRLENPPSSENEVDDAAPDAYQ